VILLLFARMEKAISGAFLLGCVWSPNLWAAENPRPLSSSVGAEFSRFPLPGADGEVTVVMPAEAFPNVASISIAPGEDASWSVPLQEAVITESSVSFTVQCPKTLRLAEGQWDPPLEILAKLTFQNSKGGSPETRRLKILPGAQTIAEVRELPPVTGVPQGPREIRIDGKLEEWSSVPYLELPFHGKTSTMVRLCWREDGLYGACDVPDAGIETAPELPDTFRGDGLELWLETDAGRALDTTRTAHALKIAMMPDLKNKGGKARSGIVMGSRLFRQGSVECAWQPTLRGYTLEFQIPTELLAPARMNAGTRMGFHYVIFDEAMHAEDSRVFIRRFFRKPYLWAVLRFEGKPRPPAMLDDHKRP
jgi:hypothetical protein